MSLKNCRECGRDVSSSAATCPHCGAPDAWISSEALEDVEMERRIDANWRPYLWTYWIGGIVVVGGSWGLIGNNLGSFGYVLGGALLVALILGFLYLAGLAHDEKTRAWEEAMKS